MGIPLCQPKTATLRAAVTGEGKGRRFLGVVEGQCRGFVAVKGTKGVNVTMKENRRTEEGDGEAGDDVDAGKAVDVAIV